MKKPQETPLGRDFCGNYLLQGPPHGRPTTKGKAALARWAAQLRRRSTPWHFRPSASRLRQTRPAATTGDQIRRRATRRGLFGRLAVAGASVCPAGCRRHVSLSSGLSPGRQSGSNVVAGASVWGAQRSDSTGGDNRVLCRQVQCKRADTTTDKAMYRVPVRTPGTFTLAACITR